ncbi:helix-turn-helix domain-containing protein [Yinghuangia sp. YIM S09857]|uniref:PucR family transcriptional regulator n=1 Tax=Yinghuangia sp. YIM S09857 TaxID=3436929 RepID=UPI003F535005
MAPVSSIGVGNAPVSSDDLVGALLGGVPGDGPHDGGLGAPVRAAGGAVLGAADARDTCGARERRGSRDRHGPHDGHDVRDTHDACALHDAHDPRDPHDPRSLRDPRDPRDSREAQDPRAVRDLRAAQDPRDPRDPHDPHDPRNPGPVGAEMAAMLLGLPEHGTYAVLALTSVVDDGAPAQGHLASRGGARPSGGHGTAGATGTPGGLQVGSGMRAVWCAAPPSPRAPTTGASGHRCSGPHVRAHAIVHLGDAELADLVKALDPPPGLRVGVSPAVDGPAELARGRVLAERALRANPDAPVAVLEERLPAAVVADSPDLARLLISRALGPVLELPCADRDSLLSTLRAWLESGGSTRRAGNRLFYHPNTVLNRLRRYEQLTGRLLGDPVSVVELSLALDAYRLAEAR